LKRGRDLAHLDDASRHHVRIQAKKLRYAADAFAGLYPAKQVKEFMAPLKALQEELGALNDLVTAEPQMAGLSLASEAAFAAGELVGCKAAARPEYIAAAGTLDCLAAAKPFWRE
jgi:CHAD domain-containing protein